MKNFNASLISTSILLVFLSLSVAVNAQAPFTLDPGNSISGTIEENGYHSLRIDMINNTGATLNLEWALVSNTFNPNWQTPRGSRQCDQDRDQAGYRERRGCSHRTGARRSAQSRGKKSGRRGSQCCGCEAGKHSTTR